MNAEFSITQPGEVDFTMSITMPLKTWILLKKQIETAYPGWDLALHIGHMVKQAQTSFAPEDKP